MKLIVASDLHIRTTRPIARTDDYEEAMGDKLAQVADLADDNDAEVVIAGDLFDQARPPIGALLVFLQAGWSRPVYAIPGQHDLPGHSITRLKESAMGVLTEASLFQPHNTRKRMGNSWVHFFPFGYDLRARPKGTTKGGKHHIAICHTLTYRGKTEMTGGTTAKALLKKMKGYQMIIVGDNHETFVETYEGRTLISPGSLMRSSAGQMKHRPCVFLVDTEDLSFKKIYLKCAPAKEVLSRKHIDRTNQRNDRMEAFLTSAKRDFDLSLSFQKNLEAFLDNNDEPEEVEQAIWEFVECED